MVLTEEEDKIEGNKQILVQVTSGGNYYRLKVMVDKIEFLKISFTNFLSYSGKYAEKYKNWITGWLIKVVRKNKLIINYFISLWHRTPSIICQLVFFLLKINISGVAWKTRPRHDEHALYECTQAWRMDLLHFLQGRNFFLLKKII